MLISKLHNSGTSESQFVHLLRWLFFVEHVTDIQQYKFTKKQNKFPLLFFPPNKLSFMRLWTLIGTSEDWAIQTVNSCPSRRPRPEIWLCTTDLCVPDWKLEIWDSMQPFVFHTDWMNSCHVRGKKTKQITVPLIRPLSGGFNLLHHCSSLF